jgi:hypothetical protein
MAGTGLLPLTAVPRCVSPSKGSKDRSVSIRQKLRLPDQILKRK